MNYIISMSNGENESGFAVEKTVCLICYHALVLKEKGNLERHHANSRTRAKCDREEFNS